MHALHLSETTDLLGEPTKEGRASALQSIRYNYEKAGTGEPYGGGMSAWSALGRASFYPCCQPRTSHHQADRCHAEKDLLAIQTISAILAGTGPNNSNSTRLAAAWHRVSVVGNYGFTGRSPQIHSRPDACMCMSTGTVLHRPRLRKKIAVM